MTDPRIKTLAHSLVTYSCAVKPDENVLLEMTGVDSAMTAALIDEVYAAGARPYVWLRDPAVTRALLRGLGGEQADLWADCDADGEDARLYRHPRRREQL